MAAFRHFCIMTLVCLVLPGVLAFTPNIKIGLNLGTGSAKPDDSVNYCTAPKEQLLKNLYVDYFHSSGPCVTPEGSKVYTFRNTEYGSADDSPTRSSLCAKLPRICHLMGRQGARGLLDVGRQVMESFSHNMRSLVHLLTGRSSPAATTNTPPAPPPPAPDSRFFTTHLKPAAIVSPSDCGNGGRWREARRLRGSVWECFSWCNGYLCTSDWVGLLVMLGSLHISCSEYGIPVCESIADIVFPMVGKSALTNTTITVVQAFPDFVQPVFFRKCRTHQAQVIYGHCIQEYLPVSLYVTPPYPGAVLAQDFIMVESGCHVKADVTYHKWRTHARHTTQHENSTNEVDEKFETMRESDRRLF